MKYRMLSVLRRFEKNTIPEMLLYGCWFAGSSLGFMAASFCGDAYASFFLLLPGQVPDWGGVFVSAVLPLLLSACAVFLFREAGCYCCCLLRGLGQGLLIGVISSLFGSGAPLMVFLVLFSALCVNPVMLVFWLRRLWGHDEKLLVDTVAGMVVCLTIGAMDHLVIAPFLVDVINL